MTKYGLWRKNLGRLHIVSAGQAIFQYVSSVLGNCGVKYSLE